MVPRGEDDRDIDLGPRLTGVIWFLAVFSLLFLSLRIYCKASRKRGLWWDDYFLAISWVSSETPSAFLPASSYILLTSRNFSSPCWRL